MLINCIYDPVLVVDLEDRIVGINKAIEKYNPYQMKQQIGEIFTQLDISSEEKWRWR
jgi:hypothetical protein